MTLARCVTRTLCRGRFAYARAQKAAFGVYNLAVTTYNHNLQLTHRAFMSNINALLPEVEDPTDFPPERDAPGLRSMDSALRCAICSEIFDAPMMLHCGHTFCSFVRCLYLCGLLSLTFYVQCIRQTLRDTHECPHCRTKAEEIQLLKNVTLEELASTWRRTR